MPKSSILKILADAVESYSACAKLIIDHRYTAGMSELVIEDCTALAFLLDKLIPVNENQYDRECQSTTNSVYMLIFAIASCNHTPEVLETLVSELEAASLRISAMPESGEKHQRIANILAIIIHIIQKYLRPTPSMKLHLHRLRGPGNRDLSITTNQAGYRDATRVVVMDNGMGLFANTNSEEEQIDFLDQPEYLSRQSSTATRGDISTALWWWWCEEGKLLDGDSQPDCVVANASKVIEVLEKTKAEEIGLRRERFHERMEEEESQPRKKKKKISTEGDTEGASTSSGQPARHSSIATGNTDVASATESLAESIVESVLRPTLQSQPPPVDEAEFIELIKTLLGILVYAFTPFIDPLNTSLSILRIPYDCNNELDNSPPGDISL